MKILTVIAKLYFYQTLGMHESTIVIPSANMIFVIFLAYFRVSIFSFLSTVAYSGIDGPK